MNTRDLSPAAIQTRIGSIAGATGLPPTTVSRVRAMAESAWAPRSEQDYLDSWPWFRFERADLPDPAVRL